MRTENSAIPCRSHIELTLQLRLALQRNSDVTRLGKGCRQFWSLYDPERIGIDPLLAERGTICGTYTTLERHRDAPGFLLAFEARLAYLEKTSATELSDGSTCTYNKRRVSTTLRQVLTKFSEFCILGLST